ncbi:ATP-grasp domain-containing protein [Streptomyces sp. NBC_01750]|uniref:ATP-grasp domain-containing protein n=1 Tax=Streptomyces sp. NBC_01750 TaxID=2975928 RepID=UPI002DD90979|nr:ATP-grasp domain-containing protein [Streptomyces sp. NBC_01750]WSD34587.1 ATP-grasp domain-containing protein [Streptomyces sp. NBC_01750]
MAIRIAVIGGQSDILRAAAHYGLDTVLFHAPGKAGPDSAELCEQVVDVDLLDEEAIAAEVRRAHADRPFRRVLTLTEPGLLPAARLNAELGLGGNSPRTVELLKDKSAMRLLLADTGLSPVRHRVVQGADELAAFVDGLGGPAIIKPLDHGGSADVQRIEGPADADAAWREVKRVGRSRMLAEEYLEGSEISLEAFSVAGRHTVVAITDKLLGPRFIEFGQAVPAELGPELTEASIALTQRLLDAAGLVEGPSHTELKLTPAGPRIVESHNRTGGDSIPELVELAYGVDLVRMAVGLPLELETWDHAVPPAKGGAAIRFIEADPGTVTAVRRPTAERDGVSIALKATEGTVVPPLTWSVDRVCGHVIATGRSAAEAIERCELTLRDIDVVTAPAPAPAPAPAQGVRP